MTGKALHYHEASGNFKLWNVLAASSVGTLIEWYDFYIFGSLATIISKRFFPPGHETAALLSTLAVFATGFIVRPFGAIVFGRIGDIVGRKYTFLLTLLLMGGATFAIGLLPDYATIGILAPVILVALRLLQGLALGGEYGGAATYIAEHSPDERRGFYTSFIQTTATLGLFLSLGVILTTRLTLGEAAFADWGWRIPFIVSIALILISYYIRVRMEESPLFAHAKAHGKTAKNPLKESFGNPENLKLVILALLGATAGQGVVWYTGQFYALFFLQTALKIDLVTTNIIIAIALILGTPFFVVFGHLSDKIGRKRIILLGCLLGALTYVPIYMAMRAQADPASASNFETMELVVTRKNTAGTEQVERFSNSEANQGKVKEALSAAALPENDPGRAKIVIKYADAKGGIPIQPILLTMLVLIQVLYVTMVYGPIAAFLVELFPTRIRYTSMSLPYHVGNGVFGGLVPFIATALVASTGNPYAGLFYPIGIALLTFIIGSLFIRDTRNVKLWGSDATI
ncbi:MAG: MHS family MFS transporter [Leptospirales bacterium]|nr:MHS family MFS transporter [Leptospirales bacterium]